MKLSIFVLCIVVLVTGAFAETNPFNEIKILGFNPTLTKPADFSTEMGFKNEGSLSDYKGKWIMLAFWATWCGPCKYEMPILEELHQKLKDQGLVILGVSIDKPGSEKAIKKFLKQKKISFPNFLDAKGEISREYFANAVPSIYLISPDWKLVGIARGAREWSGSKIIGSLTRLLKIKEIPNDAEIERNSISLPSNLAPPILKSALSKTVANIGEQINLDIFIQWHGKLEQYLFKVPKPHLPTNIEVGQVSSESFQKEGIALLKYSYPLTFQEAGDYTVGPIEMEYKSRLGGGFQATREPGKKIQIASRSLNFFLFCFIGFLGILLGFYFWKKQKKEITGDEEKTKDFSQLKIEWENTKKEIEKDLWESGEKSSQLILLKFAIKVKKELGLDVNDLEKTLNEVQFANMTLSQSHINIISKDLDNNLRES